jgi:hypothetical protein
MIEKSWKIGATVISGSVTLFLIGALIYVWHTWPPTTDLGWIFAMVCTGCIIFVTVRNVSAIVQVWRGKL